MMVISPLRHMHAVLFVYMLRPLKYTNYGGIQKMVIVLPHHCLNQDTSLFAMFVLVHMQPQVEDV